MFSFKKWMEVISVGEPPKEEPGALPYPNPPRSNIPTNAMQDFHADSDELPPNETPSPKPSKTLKMKKKMGRK